jgi:hypothetical protein
MELRLVYRCYPIFQSSDAERKANYSGGICI